MGMLVECWKGWGWQQWQEKEEGKIWMRTGRLVVGNDSSRDAIFFSYFFKSGFHSVCAHSYFFLFFFYQRWYSFFFFHLCNQTEVDFQGQWLESYLTERILGKLTAVPGSVKTKYKSIKICLWSSKKMYVCLNVICGLDASYSPTWDDVCHLALLGHCIFSCTHASRGNSSWRSPLHCFLSL